jgi:hypothetical protein
MIRIMRRLTLLDQGVIKRIKIMLKVNLDPSSSQHIDNVLIRERPKNVTFKEPYKEEKERPYLLINELN